MSLDGIQIRQVRRLQTICDIFNQQLSLKKFLTEVHKLLKIYLTVTVTLASAKHNFPTLKRIKAFLRNAMTAASKSLHVAAYLSGQDRNS